ncbi:MAG: hypothetical protein QM630_00830 [Microbacterium sp.]
MERFDQQLSYWQSTDDTFTTAAGALDDYPNALEWAQGEAALAIELWNAAETESAAALVEHQEYVSLLRRGTGVRHAAVDVPFIDPAGPVYQEARDVLANARYQLDVLATGYANIIGNAGEAAPLPLTVEQAHQALQDAAVRTVIEVGVVDPFHSTLNFLGGIAQTLWEHPDLVLEMLAGILGIAAGGAVILGGGGLEVVTIGGATPIAVPAIATGAAVATGGALLLGDGLNRWFTEAETRDPRSGVNRGDTRDFEGKWTQRDPDAPTPDYARKEQQGLDQVADTVGKDVIRDKVRVDYPGSPQGGRYYDGLYRNPDGTYTGVEVKSGSAYDDYWRPGNSQQQFDSRVSADNPAAGYLNGEEIKIVKVRVERVP